MKKLLKRASRRRKRLASIPRVRAKLFGWYSKTAADSGCGRIVYRNPDGGEVSVTYVAREFDDKFYKWPDRVFVGPVTEHVRTLTAPLYGRLVTPWPKIAYLKDRPEFTSWKK